MKEKYLNIKGGKIYYESLKKKYMIVYLHGNTLNMTCFTKEINHFKKKGYGFLALDTRGNSNQ